MHPLSSSLCYASQGVCLSVLFLPGRGNVTAVGLALVLVLVVVLVLALALALELALLWSGSDTPVITSPQRRRRE
jgi:hypothetical protein